MRVRPKKTAPAESMQPAQAFSFPAPIRGLILNENIAMASQGGAAVLFRFEFIDGQALCLDGCLDLGGLFGVCDRKVPATAFFHAQPVFSLFIPA